MKRKAILLLLAVLTLTACGQSQAPSPESSQSTNIEIPASPEASESSVDNESGTADNEVTISVPEESESATPKPEEISDEDKVLNNGNHFVQIGNRVYFRIPSAEAMNKGAVFASFLDSVPGSTLVSYDLTTGETNPVTADNGCGKLYVSNGILMVTNSMDDETKTYTMLEGIKLKTFYVYDYDGQSYLGVDPTGTYVVISDFDYLESHTRYTILKDGVHHAEISCPELYDYVGFCDGTLLYITREGDELFLLKSYNLETGEEISLGEVPVSEYESYPGTPEQLWVEGSQFYLSLANYEGTGHFYAGANLLVGDAHTPDSVEEKYLEASDEEFPNHAPRFTVNLDSINKAEGIPGTADVNNDTGEIGYYDENGSWVPVLRGFSSQYSGDYETGTDVEVVEFVGDKLFVVQNDLLHTPEEDIGWRTAYRRTHTVIEMIDIKSGAVTVLAEIDNP